MPTVDRAAICRQWLKTCLGEGFRINSLAGDASFRRYFRVSQGKHTFVLMDAPPSHEDVSPFLAVRNWMEAAGLRVPALLHADPVQGLLLLEDFGDCTWAVHLTEGGDLDDLVADAFSQLARLQAAEAPWLPIFAETRMQRECDLYLDWYLPKVAGIRLDENRRKQFHAALMPIYEFIARLPRVPVHLDFHSRNLMLPAGKLPLGIIDFQDAVIGPVTYDLASLLYDCYQDYPESARRAWSVSFYQSLPKKLAAAFAGADDWHRALRLTAFQRHIKATGIFARLAFRDGKRQFLDEIPLTRKHMLAEIKDLDLPKDVIALLEHEPLSPCYHRNGQ